MKVYTTTQKHDLPSSSLTSFDIMAMLDMHQHWIDNPDVVMTIKPTPDGSDAYVFVHPHEREWSYMREASILMIRMPNHTLQPMLIA